MTPAGGRRRAAVVKYTQFSTPRWKPETTGKGSCPSCLLQSSGSNQGEEQEQPQEGTSANITPRASRPQKDIPSRSLAHPNTTPYSAATAEVEQRPPRRSGRGARGQEGQSRDKRRGGPGTQGGAAQHADRPPSCRQNHSLQRPRPQVEAQEHL